MRHNFAGCLAMAGVDLYTISDLLGHADLIMTKRYAHLAPGIKPLLWKNLLDESSPFVAHSLSFYNSVVEIS
jgi:integrase